MSQTDFDRSRSKTHRVLIVGCGNLGSRHLQAVASLPLVGEIDVVDSDPKAFEKARNLLGEISPRETPVTFRWGVTPGEMARGGDLCVVATQAKGRCELVMKVHEILGYKKFLIEKVVSQSVGDYENLLDYAKRHGLSVWVNCKARAHPSHKRMKANLKRGEPVVFTVAAGNHGLAQNGVHSADLFMFYSGEKEIIQSGASVDSVLHPSKRGKEIFDLSGTLRGKTKKGDEFSLSFMIGSNAPAHFSIASPSYRAVADDAMKWFYESRPEEGWRWEKVPYEANLMVSNMTKTFAYDILQAGTCELPTAEECFPAHRFVLEALQPSFEKLLNRKINCCPVT